MTKVPELRFAGFAGEWEEKRLKDISNIVRGSSPRPIANPKWFDENSEVGWLRIADVTEQNGRIYHLEQHLSVEGQKKTRVYKSPHLILSIAASVGKPVVNYISTGVHDGFLIFEEPDFNKEFMYQWLDNNQLMWSRYGQPGSQVNLNSEIVKNKSIYICDNYEQEKIGDLFSKIDQLIENQEKLLDQSIAFKKSMLQKMLPKKDSLVPEFRFEGFSGSWQTVKVKDIFKITRGNVLSREKTSEEKTEIFSYPVYSSQTTNNGLMGYYNDYLFDTAITWTTDGANAGNVNLRNGRFYATNVCGVLLSENEHANKAVAEILNSIAYKHVSKVGNPKLMNNVMSEIIIKIPNNIEEEIKISNFLKNLDEKIAREEKLLDAYKMMKKSLLQKMFV